MRSPVSTPGRGRLHAPAIVCGVLAVAIAEAAPLQTVLAPRGVQAARIYDLWNLMLGVCTAAFVAVMIGLVVALRRSGRANEATAPDTSRFADPEKRVQRHVTVSVGIVVALLLALLAASVFTDRALARLPLGDALRLDITAHQFWWEVRYDDDAPSRIFTTANELWVPVGRPVLARLRSDDVIHSLWIPNLHGKKDLIPGDTSTLQFRADAPGDYRAQCAEFCGYQHAWMAMHVRARPAAEFERWAEQQRQSAAEPADDAARRGMTVFMTGPCAMCHNIQGTDARGQTAPDLTHVASRPFLAAGRLPNTADNMAAWIANPQAFKPGVNMPAIPLPPDDLRALVAYLQTLR